MHDVLELKSTAAENSERQKDTWILRLPDEVCRREGLAEGPLISLTIRNGEIQTTIIRPPALELQQIGQKLLEKNKELYAELKRLGD